MAKCLDLDGWQMRTLALRKQGWLRSCVCLVPVPAQLQPKVLPAGALKAGRPPQSKLHRRQKLHSTGVMHLHLR